MAIKDSYQTADNPTGFTINSANDLVAHLFQADSSYDIDTSSIVAYRVGSPGNITVTIQGTTLDGASYIPDGVDLVTPTTFNGNTITTDVGGEWIEVNFPDTTAIVQDTRYAIVVSGASTDGSNYIRVLGSTTGGDVSVDFSSNGGSSWNRYVDYSLLYKTTDVSVSLQEFEVYRYLVAAADGAIWYESFTTQGTMVKLQASEDEGVLDTTKPLMMCEGFQKVFIVNDDVYRIADFVNTKLDLGSGNEMTTAPDRGAILVQATSGAEMLVDFVDSTLRYIYGKTTTAVVFDTTNAVSGGGATGGTLIPNVVSEASTTPHWYTWEMYPKGTTGSLPSTASLICLYRGRVVLSGNTNDPFQWYMTRQNNPFDLAYFSLDAQSPVAGQDADAGKIGDVVRSLIPYHDDYLLIGCSNSLYYMQGDPASGGTLNLLDDKVGIFGPCSFCWDGDGNLNIFATDGINQIPSTGAGLTPPKNISNFAIPTLMRDLSPDPTTHRITMGFDRNRHGLMIMIALISEGTNQAYWFDLVSGGLFPEVYPEECVAYSMFYYNSLDEQHSDLLVGGQDGYIRKWLNTAKDDDIGATDEAIDSYVLMPVLQIGSDIDHKGRMISLTFVNAGGGAGGNFADTDSIVYSIFVADDAETLVENVKDDDTPLLAGTLTGTGRKNRIRDRASGVYLGVKIGNSTAVETWALEKLECNFNIKGKVQ